MASLNKVILIGNLVADPELKKTPSGVSVTSFRIAVGRRFTKDEAQQADFIDIVAWRNTAEFITKYFNKGKSILICGSIQTRSWTDQNGQKRYSVEVVADEASFVERKSDEQNTNGTPMIDTSTDGLVEVPSDEDLPF